MAGRRGSAAKAAKAAPAVAKENLRKRKAERAESLLEKEDLQEARGKKKKALSVDQQVAEAVARAIRDNLKGVTAEQLDLVERNGQSLRARLTADKRAWLVGERRESMGKLYYAGLRGEYGITNAEGLLDVLNEEDPEDPHLVAACTAVFGRKRSLQPLTTWLTGSGVPNQRMLVGLLRCCLQLSPRHSAQYNGLALHLLEWATMHKLWEKHPEESKAMKRYFNAALVRVVGEYKKHEQTKTQFWARHRHLCEHLLPVERADRCFSCKGRWSEVAEDLRAVVDSGELGFELFYRALCEVSTAAVTELIGALLKTALGGKVTGETLGELTQALGKEMQAVGRNSLEGYPAGRTAEVAYLGVKLTIGVASAADELQLQYWGAVKTALLTAKVMDDLWGDSGLVGKMPLPDGLEVEKALAEELMRVRRLANSYLEDTGEALSRSAVKNILDTHGSFLVKQDGRFRLEVAFYTELLNGLGDARYKEAVLQCLPNAGEGPQVTMGQALASLQRVVAGPAHAWASASLQAAGLKILELVRSLVDGRSACWRVEDAFVQQARATMAVWCCDGHGAEPAPVPGEACARAAYARLEQMIGKKESVPFQEFQKLAVFGWLLSEAQARQLAAWADAAAGAAVAAEPAARKAAPRAAAHRGESGRSQVASLFAKANK